MIEMVKASVLEGVGQLEIRDYPRPEIGKNDILMRMEMCGVCGTDIHLYKGNMEIPFPVIPGHEFVGRIQELGEGAGGLEGAGAGAETPRFASVNSPKKLTATQKAGLDAIMKVAMKNPEKLDRILDYLAKR